MAGSNIDAQLIEQVTKQVLEQYNSSSPAPQPSAPVSSPLPNAGGSGKKMVPCNLSVRHIHLCREHLDQLFGVGSELEPMRELYQPGQYAAKQVLTLVGPRMRCMGEVRVLGPLRPATQVEVSRTDAIYLGIDPPVNPSGNHEGSVGLILVGPEGVVHLQQGVILANRHVHIAEQTAKEWGLVDNQTVKVRVKTHKSTLLEDCQIRVHKAHLDEMHLDTDDGNACGLRGGEMVEIVL